MALQLKCDGFSIINHSLERDVVNWNWNEIQANCGKTFQSNELSMQWSTAPRPHCQLCPLRQRALSHLASRQNEIKIYRRWNQKRSKTFREMKFDVSMGSKYEKKKIIWPRNCYLDKECPIGICHLFRWRLEKFFAIPCNISTNGNYTKHKYLFFIFFLSSFAADTDEMPMWKLKFIRIAIFLRASPKAHLIPSANINEKNFRFRLTNLCHFNQT